MDKDNGYWMWIYSVFGDSMQPPFKSILSKYPYFLLAYHLSIRPGFF